MNDFLSGIKVTPETNFLVLDNPEDRRLLHNTLHYMYYALAAYGWPMYILQSKALPLCKAVSNLTTSVACCCVPLCASKLDEPAVIVEDNCCSCNLSTLKQVQG